MLNKSQIDESVLEMVASGQATTRADIARSLAVAPSTASASIIRLISKGFLEEGSELESTGGRRARQLLLRNRNSRAMVAELGANHARVALVGISGEVEDPFSMNLRISDGPEQVLTSLLNKAQEIARSRGLSLGSVGVGIPGPVDVDTGVVVGPSRMPGWNNANVKELVDRLAGLPSIVDNDARLGAVGELAFRTQKTSPHLAYRNYVYIKAGSAIGGSLVVDGIVYRGAFGIAGDVTHVPVAAAKDRPCRCGNRGCLDTIASAEAVRKDLVSLGLDIPDNESLLAAAINADPQVVNTIRDAGTHLGASLAHVVAFLNPQAVIIGGTLSAVGAFQAGIRQSLHELCLPATMENLAVESALAGRDAALWGLADPANLLITKTEG